MDKSKIIEIGKGAWRLDGEISRSMFFVGTEKALLIDTSLETEDIYATAKSMTDLPITVVLTHADADHSGGLYDTDAVYMHPAEFAYFEQMYTKPIKTFPIWEGDVIDIGGRSFEVILIPGHTPGSIALLDKENRILVSGDSVSATPIFIFGEIRSIPALIASFDKLIKIRDQFDDIYPGHGDCPITPSCLDDLKEGAIKLLNGELEGTEPLFGDLGDALVYSWSGASFIY